MSMGIPRANLPKLQIPFGLAPDPDEGMMCESCGRFHAHDHHSYFQPGIIFAPGVNFGRFTRNGWHLVGACQTCLHAWTRAGAMYRLHAFEIDELMEFLGGDVLMDDVEGIQDIFV